MLRRRRKTGARRRLRKLRFVSLLALLSLVATVSFAYGFTSALADELSTLGSGALDPRPQENGYIYASDGQRILAVLRGPESRVVVPSERIAPVMKQAIVAIEDRRFWEHRGVDLRGIARAFWADVQEKEVIQGGSTITQQFVKIAFTDQERTIARKLREAALAWQLERDWSKDRILTAYLNTIYFGNGAYGVQMASRVYFGKPAAELTLDEAALLAGIPANPSAYDPVLSPGKARKRRLTVLLAMLEQGLIDRAELVLAARAPLPDPNDVRLPGTRGPAQHFVQYVKQRLIPYYGEETVYGGGLRVTTSIDLELQRLAQRAIDKWLARDDGPAAALVAIDPRDGRVLAMVGGRSFSKSQFNLAVQGLRQPGSAFKPFVLAAALASGISPATVYESKPTTIDLGDRPWYVTNYEDAYLGEIDLVHATVHSDNSVYAQLTAQVTPERVSEMASRLGIRGPLDDYFGIGLGVDPVSPLDMARAYATFANGGARIDGALLGDPSRAVIRVAEGGRVDENAPVPRQVIDPNDAALVTSILEQVVEHGTGRRADLEERPAAGKTGTTDNYGDAWFVGYTPQIAVAVWVGFPTKLVPMETGFNGEPVAGGTYPALIWKTFVSSALDALEEPPADFEAPTAEYAAAYQVVHRDGEWLLDNGNCRDSRSVVYFAGFEPSRYAECKPNEVDVPDVIGAPLEDAEARLASMPLTPEIVARPAKAGEELGVVVAQYPEDGTLSSWDTVQLVIPRAVHGTVPRVTGLTVRQARKRLAEVDIAGVVDAYADGEAGVVLAQDPRVGVAAEPNMSVNLVVGRG